MAPSGDHRTRTLWLCGVLHGFTHVYNVVLLPLYLMMQQDLGLDTVSAATLLVTAMGVAYFLPSYPLGVLADRFSKRRILAAGLALNALGFVGLAFAPNYAWAMLCAIVAGLGGSFYHPAATALVAGLFPGATGRALGLLGIGASLGFFAGPIYSGWRAELSGNWRTPVLELGLLGLLAAALFAWLAEERPGPDPANPSHQRRLFPRPILWGCFLGAAVAFSLRDFAGSAMGSLGSLFLQKAHAYTPKATGLALAGLFIASAISNPIFGRLSDRGRKRWIASVLLLAAALMVAFPHLPRALLPAALVAYGCCILASYPMVEAALMESVPPAVRGRVFGLFITVGGFVGNLAHWTAGEWVKSLGDRAALPHAYYPHYALLAALVLVSLAGLPCLLSLQRREAGLASPSTAPAGLTREGEPA